MQLYILLFFIYLVPQELYTRLSLCVFPSFQCLVCCHRCFKPAELLLVKWACSIYIYPCLFLVPVSFILLHTGIDSLYPITDILYILNLLKKNY